MFNIMFANIMKIIHFIKSVKINDSCVAVIIV